MRKVLKTILSIALSLLLVFTLSVDVNIVKASEDVELKNSEIEDQDIPVEETDEEEAQVEDNLEEVEETIETEDARTFNSIEKLEEETNSDEKLEEETNLDNNLESVEEERLDKPEMGAASVDETVQHTITYKVSFEDKGLGSVPGSIYDFFNRSTTKVNHGDSYSAVSPDQTEVLVVGGMWRFKGYDVNHIDSVTDDTVITAQWEQVWNNLTLNYVFISANTDELPHDVLDLLPSAENVEFGKSYTVKQPAKNRVEVDDGRWDFVGYDYDVIDSVKESIDIRGVWKFTRIEKPEPIEVDPIVDKIPEKEEQEEKPVDKDESSDNEDDKNTVDTNGNKKTDKRDKDQKDDQVKDKDLTKETAKKLSKKSKSVKNSKVDSDKTAVKLVASGKSPQTSDANSVPYMYIVLSLSLFALLGTLLVEKKRS